MDALAIAGRRFDRSCAPGNGLAIQTGLSYRGQPGWTAFRADKGWRPANTNPLARRSRLDGWPDTFAHGASARLAFAIMLQDGCQSLKADDWLVAFEMHARSLSGAPDPGHGPAKIETCWSTAAGRGVARITQSVPVLDAAGLVVSTVEHFHQFDWPAYVPHEFVVEFRDDLVAGYLRVSLFGKVVYDSGSLGFGYGAAYALYPEIGAYCNDSRAGPVRLMARWGAV